MQSRFANPRHGPAAALEHTNSSVQHTQLLLREPQASHGREGGGQALWQWHEGDMRMAAMPNQTSSGTSQPQAGRAKPGHIFFPTISHVFTPLCHAPIPAAPALLCLLLPWLCASSGSLLGTVVLLSWGCTQAPATLARTWWWQSFPRRNSPWTRLQGAWSSLLLLAPCRGAAAAARLMLQPFPGSASIRTDGLGVSRLPQVVFSLSTLESGSLALE